MGSSNGLLKGVVEYQGCFFFGIWIFGVFAWCAVMAIDAIFTQNSGNLQKCPICGGEDIGRAGKTKAGKQRYRCRAADCRKYFVNDPGVPAAVKIIVDRLAQEGVSTALIARVMAGACSKRWIYQRVKNLGE